MDHSTFISQQSLRSRAAWGGVAIAIAAVGVAATLLVAQPPRAQVSALDPLRNDALIGNAEASQMLVRQLLDQYDRSADDTKLYEATMWFDRDGNTPEFLSTSVSSRLVERQCSHPVLRWHWLCAAGE
ncbi:conserved hypothetical protein [Burkholderiales bacterium 8X]|nr:conserved hypothetical protein [Burkholderiales bacterium 8X]